MISLADEGPDLAADPAVDLVVCSVRVDRHFETVKPSLIAGKSVFVEWPLERNLEIAKEMAALAASHNAKTMVGIQGSFSSVARKVSETIKSGKIGEVLSSTFFSSEGNGGKTEVKNVRYFIDREVGGNVLSIRVGHSIEVVTSGELFYF
jgi:predicted dehydrogenase